MEIQSFYETIAGFSPNPLQEALWGAYRQAEGHPSLLVRAGTGAGKTEAVLFPALADRNPERRILWVLPSKALIEDMGERVRRIGERLSSTGMADLNITVDMGGSCRRYQCRNGIASAQGYHRHLFADDIILTSLDKFLFRMFGYGEKIKSFIFPHRVFGSALGKQPFVIFDEAHEYDGPAFSNFIRLVEALYTKGKDLCVMSATLPPGSVDFLDTVDATCGALGERQAAAFQGRIRCSDKKLTLVPAEKGAASSGSGARPGALVTAIAEAVRKRHAPSHRMIARAEYVSDLVVLFEALKDLDPLIYHGRMTSHQRREVIREIIRRQEADAGFLVIATSAIEAGCDLDAHVIVTEMCNPDSLVQLAGRLNRRGQMADAELVVVGADSKPKGTSLSGEQVEGYQACLREMNGLFSADALSPYFQPPRGDWMGEILFDMLWEYVYEGDLSAKPLWDRGILVTRSWEPAVTLCTGLEKGSDRPLNPIQVGVSRLARAIPKPAEELKKLKASDHLDVTDEEQWHADVERAYYNADRGEESRWARYPLPEKYPVSCYETDLICIIRPEHRSRYFDETLGYVRIPRIFLAGYKDGFKRYLDYHPQIKKKDGCFAVGGNFVKRNGRIWYLER